jgi:hypothetical protein
MQKIIANPANVDSWKKFFLLPIILFSPYDESSRKKALQRRLNLIDSNTWDSFTTSSLRLRKLPQDHQLSTEQIEKAHQHRIQKLAAAGEIGKIMTLISTVHNNIAPTPATVAALQTKHPTPSPYAPHPDILSALEATNLIDSARTAFEIHGDRLRSWIHNKKDFVTPGLDNVRWEHLRQLIGRGGIERPDEERFAELLADILVLLIDVTEVPTEVYDALRDNALIAIPKGNGDVRPIGMGSTIRKLCSIAFLSHTHKNQHAATTSTFNSSHFHPIQYGLQPKGTEQVIHGVRYAMERSPENDVFLMDADNAFNKVSRLKGLQETLLHFPQIIPFLNKIYRHDSVGWFFGLETGIEKILSREGFHQGDVLSSWLFCMTIHPLLCDAASLIGDNGLLKFYIDDGNLVCPHDRMLTALTFLDTEGPPLGYIIKRNKGTYLLGRCASSAVALSRKQHLIDTFGFHPDIIRIHPDNGGLPLAYGARILGGLCGTDEFILAELDTIMTKLSKDALAIKNVEDTQVKFLLLRWCFSQKITHLQRTLPLRLCRPLVDFFTSLKRNILDDIVGSTVDDKTWALAQLAPSESGLGLLDSLTTSYGAFAASFTEAFIVLSASQPDFFQSRDLPCFADLAECTSKLSAVDPLMTPDHIFQIAREGTIKHLQHYLNQIICQKTSDAIFNTLTDNRTKIWKRSLQDPDAGLWLDCAPKTRLHAIPPKAFSKAIRLRLFLPMNDSLHGLQCPCGRNHGGRRIDDQGLHFVTGCNLKGVRHATHDTVAKHVSDLMRYCGVHTSLEGIGIFGTDNKLRPDITARNFPGAATPIAFDVRITSAVPANTLEVSNTLANDPLAPSKALRASWNEKVAKYGQLACANNIGFVPLVFDVCGRMHPDSKAVLVTCLREASRVRNIPFSKVWHFWMSSLQITLQRSVVSGIDKLTVHALQRGSSIGPLTATDHIVGRSLHISG